MKRACAYKNLNAMAAAGGGLKDPMLLRDMHACCGDEKALYGGASSLKDASKIAGKGWRSSNASS